MNFDVGKKMYKLSKLGGEGEDVIWTKSKRTAAFFGKPTLIWSGPRIRLKQINQRLSGLDELGDKAKDAEGR